MSWVSQVPATTALSSSFSFRLRPPPRPRPISNQDVDYEAAMDTKSAIVKKIFTMEKEMILKSSSFKTFLAENEYLDLLLQLSSMKSHMVDLWLYHIVLLIGIVWLFL